MVAATVKPSRGGPAKAGAARSGNPKGPQQGQPRRSRGTPQGRPGQTWSRKTNDLLRHWLGNPIPHWVIDLPASDPRRVQAIRQRQQCVKNLKADAAAAGVPIPRPGPQTYFPAGSPAGPGIALASAAPPLVANSAIAPKPGRRHSLGSTPVNLAPMAPVARPVAPPALGPQAPPVVPPLTAQATPGPSKAAKRRARRVAAANRAATGAQSAGSSPASNTPSPMAAQGPSRGSPATSGASQPQSGSPSATGTPAQAASGATRERPLPQFAGPSTVMTRNMGGTKTDYSRPVKHNRPVDVTVEPRPPRSERRAKQHLVEDVDGELAEYLMLEAALRPRNASLLIQLKGKAMRFLEKYDCSDISYGRRRRMVLAAVKLAMLIDAAEDGVRQCLKEEEQDELRQKHDKFLNKGVVGHSGLSGAIASKLGLGRDSKLAN